MKFQEVFVRVSEGMFSPTIGKQISIQFNADGAVVGVWLDDEPITGAVCVNDFVQKLVGRNYLQKEFRKAAVNAESVDEMALAKRADEHDLEMRSIY